MKKLIAMLAMSLCLLLAGVSHAEAADAGSVEINAVTFPDEFLRGYVLDNIDTNKDKILQKEEAEAVTKIQFTKFKDADDYDEDEKIRYYTKEDFTFDFKGLERFTNLTTLAVRLMGGATADGGTTGELVEYPVKISNESSLYRLKNLKELEIVKTDMKSFDCSKFPKLEKLYLSDFSELTKLTFKGNNKLKKLGLSDSKKLSTFNVSSLGKLTSLELQSIYNIKTIQFGKKNKALKTLRITSYTNTYFEKLKSLNLSKLTGLKNLSVANVKNLKKLDVSHNKKLRSIFMENCDKIKKIAPKKSKKLTEVDIWNCKNLKTLDLSANHKLNWLRLDGMKVKTIRLSKKNKLNYFRYANAKLKKFDVKNINPKTMKALQIYGNKLKKVNVSKYKKLESLWVDKGVKVTGRKKSTSISRN